MGALALRKDFVESSKDVPWTSMDQVIEQGGDGACLSRGARGRATSHSP